MLLAEEVIAAKPTVPILNADAAPPATGGGIGVTPPGVAQPAGAKTVDNKAPDGDGSRFLPVDKPAKVAIHLRSMFARVCPCAHFHQKMGG